MQKFRNMCTGTDKEKSYEYQILADFYSLPKKQQLLFMAFFSQLVENNNLNK